METYDTEEKPDIAYDVRLFLLYMLNINNTCWI